MKYEDAQEFLRLIKARTAEKMMDWHFTEKDLRCEVCGLLFVFKSEDRKINLDSYDWAGRLEVYDGEFRLFSLSSSHDYAVVNIKNLAAALAKDRSDARLISIMEQLGKKLPVVFETGVESRQE